MAYQKLRGMPRWRYGSRRALSGCLSHGIPWQQGRWQGATTLAYPKAEVLEAKRGQPAVPGHSRWWPPQGVPVAAWVQHQPRIPDLYTSQHPGCQGALHSTGVRNLGREKGLQSPCPMWHGRASTQGSMTQVTQNSWRDSDRSPSAQERKTTVTVCHANRTISKSKASYKQRVVASTWKGLPHASMRSSWSAACRAKKPSASMHPVGRSMLPRLAFKQRTPEYKPKVEPEQYQKFQRASLVHLAATRLLVSTRKDRNSMVFAP